MTTLTQAVGLTETTLHVDAAPRPTDRLLQIGSEYVIVRASGSRTITVERAVLGSAPAAHAAAAELVPVIVTVQTDAPAAPAADTPDLEAVLGAGNATGELVLVLPVGTIDGTTATGAVEIATNAGADDGDGVDIKLTPGAGDGEGRDGLVIISSLPTEDPEVAGALFVTDGALMVSAGA